MKANNAGKIAVVLASVVIASLLGIVGCSGGDSGEKMSKDQARSIGKADWSADFCEVNEWYGDGVCDDFCVKPDPDCGDSPKMCGGKLGSRCADDEFCKFSNNSCGQWDQSGKCEKRPEGCRQMYEPVCGCDGKTYGNSCSANMDGVDVRMDGVCEEEGGCDGKACGDRCDTQPGIPMYCDVDGACGFELPVCEPICTTDDDCAELRCPFWGGLHQTCEDGKCVNPPITNCPDVECGTNQDCSENKVCVEFKCVLSDEGGCDGKVCGDRCDAQPGIPMYCDAAGACSFGVPDCGPICTTDDNCAELACPFWGGLHQTCEDGKCVNPPITNCPDVECGTNQDCSENKVCVEFKCVLSDEGGCDGKVCGDRCDAQPGIPMYCDAAGTCGFENPVCGEPQMCGGIRGLTCAGDEYCDFSNGSCGRWDQAGTCQKRPETCAEEYLPVCGCGNVTFDNACLAYQSGVDVSGEGACVE